MAFTTTRQSCTHLFVKVAGDDEHGGDGIKDGEYADANHEFLVLFRLHPVRLQDCPDAAQGEEAGDEERRTLLEGRRGTWKRRGRGRRTWKRRGRERGKRGKRRKGKKNRGKEKRTRGGRDQKRDR